MYSRIFLHLLLSVLAFCWLSSCEDNDVLYGESMDDYTLTGTTKDDDARAYFARKEVACIDSKASFSTTIPRGYQNVDLILRSPDGGLLTQPTAGTFAKLYSNYESTTGGRMSVSLVTKIGYQKSLSLFGCNDRDTYFYVLVYSPDGSSLEDVAAYSIASGTLPLAYELGYETHNIHKTDLSKHTVAGIAVRRGAPTGPNRIKDILGNSGYFGYLLRRYDHFLTDYPAGYSSPGPEYVVRENNAKGVTQRLKVNGLDVEIATLDGRVETPATLVHLFNYDFNKSSAALVRFGKDDKKTLSTEVRLRFNVIRRGYLLYSFYDYATVTIPHNGVINLELL